MHDALHHVLTTVESRAASRLPDRTRVPGSSARRNRVGRSRVTPGRKIQTDTLPIWARSSACRRRDRLLLRPRADPGMAARGNYELCSLAVKPNLPEDDGKYGVPDVALPNVALPISPHSWVGAALSSWIRINMASIRSNFRSSCTS